MNSNKKQIKRILLILLFGIFIIFFPYNLNAISRTGNVGNFSEVNASYKNSNMTIEFKERETIIGNVELKSHKTYDEILNVTSGVNATVIWYEFSGFENINDLLGEVEFIDMRKQIANKSIERESTKNRYITNPNYGLPTNKSYHFVYLENGRWIPYNSFNIPKDNLTIGVQTDLGWGEYLDVRLNVLGNKLDKHAVVIGTNAGFVTTAPTTNPLGSTIGLDTRASVSKALSPATATKITEIGFWVSEATQEANFEIALYAADGTAGAAGTRLYVSATNAKGTTSGWKKITVDWAINASTNYWIGVQLDDTATTTNTADSYDTNAGIGEDYIASATTLNNPFGGGAIFDTTETYAFYAIWGTSDDTTAPTYSNIQVNDTTPQILDAVIFSTLWSDNIALSNYTFSWNATGVSCDTWANDSTVRFTGILNWSNITKSIPSTCLLANVPSIAWRVWANDSSGKYNVTPITFSFSGSGTTYTISVTQSLSINNNLSKTVFFERITNLNEVFSSSLFSYIIKTRQSDLGISLGNSLLRSGFFSQISINSFSLSDSLLKSAIFSKISLLNIDLSDSLLKNIIFSRIFTNELNLNQSLFKSFIRSISNMNSLSISDLLIKNSIFQRLNLQSININFALLKTSIFERITNLNEVFSSSLFSYIIKTRQSDLGISLGNSLLRSGFFSQISINSFSLSDSLLKNIIFSRISNQGIILDHSLFKSAIFLKFTSDNFVLSQSILSIFNDIGLINNIQLSNFLSLFSSLDKKSLFRNSISQGIDISETIRKSGIFIRTITQIISNFFATLLGVLGITTTPPSGGGGGFGLETLNPIVCNYTYYHLLDYGEKNLEILYEKIINEGINISAYDMVNLYIKPYQGRCSEVIHRSLKSEFVCYQVFEFVTIKNYSISFNELEDLRKIISDKINITHSLTRYYIENYNEVCRDYLIKEIPKVEIKGKVNWVLIIIISLIISILILLILNRKLKFLAKSQ